MMLCTVTRTDWRHQAKTAEELTAAVGDNDDHGDDLETGLFSSDN
jgi:MATE family multidrug resistance protein